MNQETEDARNRYDIAIELLSMFRDMSVYILVYLSNDFSVYSILIVISVGVISLLVGVIKSQRP